MAEAEYLTTQQAAAILEVTPGWVAALCRAGSLEAVQSHTGAPWKIVRSSIDELLAIRAGVGTHDLDRAADRIASNKAVSEELVSQSQAKGSAKEKAEESLIKRVVDIVKDLGAGVAAIVGGALCTVLLSGNPIGVTVGPILVAEGLKELFKSWRERRAKKGG